VLVSLSAHQLALLGAAACIGGAVFGVAGFAFGVIASLFLHHAFPAADVVFIVVAGALLLNLGLLPRFRRDIDLRRALPFLAGATLGLPIGLALLEVLDARTIRVVVAGLLIAYCLLALRQQSRAPLRLSPGGGRAADVSIGLAGGVVGGISGLGPLLPAIWNGLRGLDKREQRALAQPFGLYVQGAMVAWLLATGTVSRDAAQGIIIAAPLMIGAAWLGLRLFDRIDTATFQRVVTSLALAGAVLLLANQF
jgi:hypothetical protein